MSSEKQKRMTGVTASNRSVRGFDGDDSLAGEAGASSVAVGGCVCAH